MHDALAVHLTLRHPIRESAVREILLALGGSLLIAALAQVVIPLGFTPVPITGQTLGVLLVGAALGSRRGAASVALYLAQGLAGLPFFSGGTAGLAVLIGPVGGYLMGFLPAAFVAGWLAEKGLDRRFRSALAPFLVGEVIIYACGLSWLALFVGWSNVLSAGLLPFIPGDLIKLALAGAALPTAWKIAGRFERD